MNLITFDDVLKDPSKYVEDIESYGFQEIASGDKTFHNVQPRDNNDEFAEYVLSMFPGYKIKWNVIRKSDPDIESKKLNYEGMTGDITAVLFLSDVDGDEGTVIFDDEKNVLCTVYSKFNRMVAFDSDVLTGGDAFEYSVNPKKSKISQVIFLEEKK
jgi:hypothetical protein